MLSLHAQSIEAIAQRVVELLEEREPKPQMVDARGLAEVLGVSVDAVYAGASELGGIRVGKRGSRRPRLVFDLNTALARRNRTPRLNATEPAARKRRQDDESVPLLPIRGGT